METTLSAPAGIQSFMSGMLEVQPISDKSRNGQLQRLRQSGRLHGDLAYGQLQHRTSVLHK
jgi:hypothetical protein